MAFAQNAKEFVMKWKIQLLAAAVVLALSSGAWYGWQKYTHAQSPEAYAEKLNAALAAKDLESLATLVDFRELTEDIATRILAQPMPSAFSTPNQQEVPLLAEQIQNFFLANIKEPKDAPTDDYEVDPLDPIFPLPVDFIKQIAGNFIVETKVNNGAILSVKMHYPRLDKEYPFYFFIKQNPEWRLTRLANAEELLKTYVAEETVVEAGRKKVYDKQRAQDLKRIEAQFHVEECTAFIHSPRGQTVPLLMVRIAGYNKGPFVIRNMTFDTTVNVQNEEAELAFEHKINTAARLNVGTNLEDSYSLELETESREAKILLGAKKLTCTATVHFMTLDNGTMLKAPADESTITKPLPKK